MFEPFTDYGLDVNVRYITVLSQRRFILNVRSIICFE